MAWVSSLLLVIMLTMSTEVLSQEVLRIFSPPSVVQAPQVNAFVIAVFKSQQLSDLVTSITQLNPTLHLAWISSDVRIATLFGELEPQRRTVSLVDGLANLTDVSFARCTGATGFTRLYAATSITDGALRGKTATSAPFTVQSTTVNYDVKFAAFSHCQESTYRRILFAAADLNISNCYLTITDSCMQRVVRNVSNAAADVVEVSVLDYATGKKLATITPTSHETSLGTSYNVTIPSSLATDMTCSFQLLFSVSGYSKSLLSTVIVVVPNTTSSTSSDDVSGAPYVVETASVPILLQRGTVGSSIKVRLLTASGATFSLPSGASATATLTLQRENGTALSTFTASFQSTGTATFTNVQYPISGPWSCVVDGFTTASISAVYYASATSSALQVVSDSPVPVDFHQNSPPDALRVWTMSVLTQNAYMVDQSGLLPIFYLQPVDMCNSVVSSKVLAEMLQQSATITAVLSDASAGTLSGQTSSTLSSANRTAVFDQLRFSFSTGVTKAGLKFYWSSGQATYLITVQLIARISVGSNVPSMISFSTWGGNGIAPDGTSLPVIAPSALPPTDPAVPQYLFYLTAHTMNYSLYESFFNTTVYLESIGGSNQILLGGVNFSFGQAAFALNPLMVLNQQCLPTILYRLAMQVSQDMWVRSGPLEYTSYPMETPTALNILSVVPPPTTTPSYPFTVGATGACGRRAHTNGLPFTATISIITEVGGEKIFSVSVPSEFAIYCRLPFEQNSTIVTAIQSDYLSGSPNFIGLTTAGSNVVVPQLVIITEAPSTTLTTTTTSTYTSSVPTTTTISTTAPTTTAPVSTENQVTSTAPYSPTPMPTNATITPVPIRAVLSRCDVWHRLSFSTVLAVLLCFLFLSF